jgi:hypothetical protein
MGNMSGKLLPEPFRRIMLLMKNHLAGFSLQFSLSNPLVGELPYMSRAILFDSPRFEHFGVLGLAKIK